MSPWVTRTFILLFYSGSGALLGGVLGAQWDFPVGGALTGVLLTVGVVAVIDAAGARHLMEWLRSPTPGAAPTSAGLWAEIHYRAEKELRLRDETIARERAQLQQFLAAIEASPNGVLLLGVDDELAWCNAVAREHFRLDARRDIGQRVTNLVRHPAFVSHIQGKGLEGGLVMPGGAGRTTLSIVTRLYGQGMRLVLSQDITERERADAMRRDFVANVSHEIRTPLTVLAGFVETMASLPLTEVERKRVMVLMEQQTARMQALVGDLLALAKLEGSPRPPIDEWTGVHSLMRHVMSDATVLSDGRHRLSVDGGSDAEIAGSHGELLSAVANLVNNAVRYTPSGGEVCLSWQWRPEGGGVFVVTDTGPGIAPEHLLRVTERFYRVDSSRSRDTGGTGLGLSIVKHVAQRHGGDIEVQSTVGKGSCFRLLVPQTRVRRLTVPAVDATPSTLNSD